MHEFDRFLDRDDVATEVDVDVIEQGRQRGGFAGTGGPVTSTRPLRMWPNSFTIGGMPSCSRLAILVGMIRNTAA
jgi:hypothetical protein